MNANKLHNESSKNWNIKFLSLALEISGWSKDKSYKIAAIIADKENVILSTGYNGFPINVDDSIEERYERPIKYKWTEHAERNAIYFAARKGVCIKDAIIYIPWYPCADCARGIIQSGLSKVVCFEPNFEHEILGKDFAITKQMFTEANIEEEYVDEGLLIR